MFKIVVQSPCGCRGRLKLDKDAHSLIWLGRLFHKFKPDTVKL